MTAQKYTLLLFAAILCLLSVLPGSSDAVDQPMPVPLGEQWYLIRTNGERSGFLRTSFSKDPSGFLVTTEGSTKMRGLGFSREAVSREQYWIGRNLALRSFVVVQTIDGVFSRISGEAVPAGLRVATDKGTKVQEKVVQSKGEVYPPPVINIYPLLHGPIAGKTWRVSMFDPEVAKLKKVKIGAVGQETTDGGSWHFQNDLYPVVDNDVWIDATGKTLRESVREGLVETQLESEKVGRLLLVEDAVSGAEYATIFSRLPIDLPNNHSTVVLRFGGMPASFSPPPGEGQWERLQEGRFLWTSSASNGAESVRGNYLTSSEWFPANDPVIAGLAEKIIAKEIAPQRKVEAISSWILEHVKDSEIEAKSIADAVNTGKANKVDRARLAASLCRAAGVPSRILVGLYYDKGGLVYRIWPECFVGSWIQVAEEKSTAGNLRVPLSEVDAPSALIPISELLGHVTVAVAAGR